MRLIIIVSLLVAVVSGGTLERRFKNAPYATKTYGFMAAIFSGSYDRIFCGGVLIRSDLVLTAAHCAFENLNSYSLFFNTRSVRFEVLNKLTKYKVKKVILHDQFKIMGNIITTYDIGLLQLKGHVTGVDPIILATRESLADARTGIVTGWAYHTPSHISLATRELYQATFTIYNSTACHNVYRDDLQAIGPYLTPTQSHTLDHISSDQLICAMGHNQAQANEGDSGGPLFITHQNQYQLAGLVSYTIRASERNQYTNNVLMLTNVTVFRQFIDDVMVSLDGTSN